MEREAARRKAEELVSRMTLEEKASQLRYDAPAIERLGIPEYNWWNEALHGVARAGTATMFPQAIGLAACFDEDLMEEIGSCIATEGRAKYNAQKKHGDRDIYKGITFWSPNVNIFRDPRWGRGHETYGEDPYLTSRLGVHFIHGIQGDGPYMKAAACAKHFAVHSGPEALRHSFDAEASAKDMEETYLPAFEACVKEGKVEAVMGAYNRTNGEPCCGSPKLQEILRGRWGFEGHYVSDCWAIRDFHENHHVTASPEESVKLALENGCDVNCGCTYQKVMNAVEEGILDEKYITESCIRLFTTRYLLGMFDKTEYDDIPYTKVECPEHLALASKAAAEGMVLLKNDGILPLTREKMRKGHIHTIGVIGPNADSRRALMGNYHGTSSEYVTILEGIRREFCGDGKEEDSVRILYSQGCDLFRDNVEELSKPEIPDRLAEAKTVVDYSDIVIMVMGLDETLEGEEGDTGNAYASGDKKDLSFPPFQEELIRKLSAYCTKPMIFISVSGSAMDLNLAEEKADAVLQVFYPGARGGSECAGILSGRISPSGKLPVTFYKDLEGFPDFTDYSMKGRTYRFLEKAPLYPFGFGLTYGDCRAENIRCEVLPDPSEKDGFGGATATVRIVNDGAETDEVLQLYIRDEDSSFAVPNPCLCGFARVHLKQGEAKEVTLTIDRRAFTSVREDGVRDIFGKHFTLYAAFSQPDERSASRTGHSAQSARIQL